MTESKIDDGGSAFPFEGGENNGISPEGGMTLRDWFAGQAMIAIIAATSAGQHRVLFGDNGDSIETAMAKDAFQVADAMIVARKGGA